MDILIFMLGATILHLSHHLFKWFLRKNYAFKDCIQKPNLFKPNNSYKLTEGIFVLCNAGYAVIISSVVYGNSPHADIIFIIAMATFLIGSIESLIDLNKQNSYFKFSDTYLKWNFALGNPHSKTLKIELEDISCVEDRAGHLVVILNNGKEFKITKSDLRLLNGFGLLKERLVGLDHSA